MALSETEERAEHLGELRGEMRQMNERLGRVEDQLGDLRREMHSELNKVRGELNKVRDDLNKLGWKIAATVVVAVLVNQLLPLLTR